MFLKLTDAPHVFLQMYNVFYENTPLSLFSHILSISKGILLQRFLKNSLLIHTLLCAHHNFISRHRHLRRNSTSFQLSILVGVSRGGSELWIKLEKSLAQILMHADCAVAFQKWDNNATVEWLPNEYLNSINYWKTVLSGYYQHYWEWDESI